VTSPALVSAKFCSSASARACWGQPPASPKPGQSCRGLLRVLVQRCCPLAWGWARARCLRRSWAMPARARSPRPSTLPVADHQLRRSDVRRRRSPPSRFSLTLTKKICRRVGFLLSQLSLLHSFCFKSTETAPKEAIDLVTQKSLKLFQFSCKILDNLI